MIPAIFMTLSILGMYAFVSIGGPLSRAIYLKLSFDFAAISVMGIGRSDHEGETRVISICLVVVGVTLSFLYFVIQHQKEVAQDES